MYDKHSTVFSVQKKHSTVFSLDLRNNFQNHMASDCVLDILSAEEKGANIYMIVLSFRNQITFTGKKSQCPLYNQRKGTDNSVTILFQAFLFKTLDGRTAAHSMYLAPQEGTNGCNPGRWMLLNLLPSVDK